MGEVAVPADKLWGAQTQRSFENFPIGEEKMPPDLIHAFGVLKEACAAANHRLGPLDTRRYQLIQSACQAIRAGELAEQFPLSVWQTGSGTQTIMNCNEVIAHVRNAQAGETLLDPNDHVNLSQSSNDTFPSALHIAAVTALHTRLEPALTEMLLCLQRLETDNQTVVKTGRTHLQDAVPITFGQEISGWRSMLEHARDMIRASLAGLYELALGGTAVGTGLNAPPPVSTSRRSSSRPAPCCPRCRPLCPSPSPSPAALPSSPCSRRPPTASPARPAPVSTSKSGSDKSPNVPYNLYKRFARKGKPFVCFFSPFSAFSPLSLKIFQQLWLCFQFFFSFARCVLLENFV